MVDEAPLDDGTVEFERQRRDRRVTHWTGDDGMAMLLAALTASPPVETVAKILEQRAEELWRDDGSRGMQPRRDAHPQWRMADVRRTHHRQHRFSR
ncbi:MAG: hypothetical protein R2695_08080 [Acidimicrobiales bacterium]